MRLLEVAHEGTSKVCGKRLQLLTTNFEGMNMHEENTISEFNLHIRDIANESLSLGVPMSDDQLVQKILRSLPERFNMKVTTIQEAHELSQMKIVELIGSLFTYEMSLPKVERKNKGLALEPSITEQREHVSSETNDVKDAIDMLAKNFGRVM